MSIDSGSSRAAVKIGSAIWSITASISASRITEAAQAGTREAQQRQREQHALAAGQDPELSPHLSSPFIDRDAMPP